MKCCVSTDVVIWTNWLTFEPDPDHSPDPGTGFLHFSGISEEVGRISIKFNVSIAAGTWSNWLGFEPDPDQSSDPGTRFTPNFFNFSGISEEVMDKFPWNFTHRYSGFIDWASEPSKHLCRRYMRSTECHSSFFAFLFSFFHDYVPLRLLCVPMQQNNQHNVYDTLLNFRIILQAACDNSTS